METRKPRNLAKKIAAVIFCQSVPLTYNELFSIRYEDDFLLHTGLYVGQALRFLNDNDKNFINDYINQHNNLVS